MKWLLQNLHRRALFAVKNPKYVGKAIWRELAFADERFLSRITGMPYRKIRSYMDEPISTHDFAKRIKAAANQLQSLSIESADLFAKKVLLQYAAVRALRPQRIVETGIANGVSAIYLLLALHNNGEGRLYSIGLNDRSFLPEGAEPGWLVPAWLRDSWEPYLGDARELLPELLTRLGSIDMFVHDSLHTYEHMKWEFNVAYPILRSGGLLIADDALWNNAFSDFSRNTQTNNANILRGVGFLRKD